MKVLVCISHVPDTTSRIAFVDNNRRLDAAKLSYIIGPYEDFALARAVELKEAGQVDGIDVLHVGGAQAEPTLRKALAIGADKALRVDTEPLDAYTVAHQIVPIVKEGNYDLVLMGRESIDYNGGLVHGMVAELLQIPVISPVMRLEVQGKEVHLTKEIEGGTAAIEAPLPLVLGCQEPIADWRIPNMRGIMTARSKPLEVLSPIDVSARVRTQVFSLPKPRTAVQLVDADRVEELVRLLKEEAKVL